MVKSVEKYLRKISKLIEESSASVGEALIKRIEDMFNRNEYLLQKHQDAHLIASAVFHELFSHYNSNRITKSELETYLPPIGNIDTFVAASEAEQANRTVQKGDICIRTDINKHLFNKTGRNKFVSDWIDVSRVVSSEEHMLSIKDVVKGEDIFRADLDKTFNNLTGKNESMSDWREVVYDSASLLLASSNRTNREHQYCNLADALLDLNLSINDELFTPETYYGVIGETSRMLYIHAIYGDIAYGYMISYDEDGPMSQINYERISLHNSKEIYSQYAKLTIISDNINDFIKTRTKDCFLGDTKMAHRLELIEKLNANTNEVIATGKKTNKLLEYLQLILTNSELMLNAHNLTIQVNIDSFDTTAEDLDEISRRVKSIHHIRGHLYEFVLKQRYWSV